MKKSNIKYTSENPNRKHNRIARGKLYHVFGTAALDYSFHNWSNPKAKSLYNHVRHVHDNGSAIIIYFNHGPIPRQVLDSIVVGMKENRLDRKILGMCAEHFDWLNENLPGWSIVGNDVIYANDEDEMLFRLKFL